MIVFPKYSFIKFGFSSPDFGYCLPIIEDSDFTFQVLSKSTTAAEADTVWALPVDSWKLILVDNNGAELRNWTVTDGYVFSRYRVSDTNIIFYWSLPFNEFDSLVDCGECFNLKLVTPDETYFSNCFKRICEDGYLTILEYWNDEDYAEFNYCNIPDIRNRARLPFYLQQPQLVEDKAVYRRSDGVIKQTRSSITKEYSVVTDHLPEDFHDKMTVALGHDNVNVLGAMPYQGGISKSDEYKVEWTDNLLYAPATFKVLATPFMISNDNCAECAEVEERILCTTISAINATTEVAPEPCAKIATINANVSNELPPIGMTVTLVRATSLLKAYITGGTPPYVVEFNCIPSGPCNSYSIDAPNQVTGLTSVATAYHTVAYAGTQYDFYVTVTDQNGLGTTVSDGPNSVMACLIPTTEVETVDGTRLICELKGGALIGDEEGKKTEVTSVTEHVVEILVNINKGLLISSEGHVHVVERDGKRLEVRAHDLKEGDHLFDRSGKLIEITSLVKMHGEFNVVNISTKSGTYLANGILTHNKLACP